MHPGSTSCRRNVRHRGGRQLPAGGGYAKVYAATREGFRVALKIEAFASVPDTTASSTRSNLGQDVSQADLPKPILTEGYLAFPCGAREHFRDFHAARSLLDPSGKGIPAHGIPGMYSVLCCLRGGYLHKVTVMQLLGPSLDEVAHEIARCPEAEAAQAKVETIGAQVLSIMGAASCRAEPPALRLSKSASNCICSAKMGSCRPVLCSLHPPAQVRSAGRQAAQLLPGPGALVDQGVDRRPGDGRAPRRGSAGALVRHPRLRLLPGPERRRPDLLRG